MAGRFCDRFRVFAVFKQWREQFRQWSNSLYILYLAVRDPRTPWYVKVIVIFVIGYTLSPIDFIPDFVPILGYIDDVVLVPLGIIIALRLVPSAILLDCRQKAALNPLKRKLRIWLAGVGVIILCIVLYFLYIRLSGS